VPWWQILLIFSLSGLVGFVGLLVLLSSGLYCYRTAKDTLFPAVTLPPHFQAVRTTHSICLPACTLFLCQTSFSVDQVPSQYTTLHFTKNGYKSVISTRLFYPACIGQ
jgi:thiosulfate reductase cytochrome b subunit